MPTRDYERVTCSRGLKWEERNPQRILADDLNRLIFAASDGAEVALGRCPDWRPLIGWLPIARRPD